MLQVNPCKPWTNHPRKTGKHTMYTYNMQAMYIATYWTTSCRQRHYQVDLQFVFLPPLPVAAGVKTISYKDIHSWLKFPILLVYISIFSGWYLHPSQLLKCGRSNPNISQFGVHIDPNFGAISAVAGALQSKNCWMSWGERKMCMDCAPWKFARSCVNQEKDLIKHDKTHWSFLKSKNPFMQLSILHTLPHRGDEPGAPGSFQLQVGLHGLEDALMNSAERG